MLRALIARPRWPSPGSPRLSPSHRSASSSATRCAGARSSRTSGATARRPSRSSSGSSTEASPPGSPSSGGCARCPCRQASTSGSSRPSTRTASPPGRGQNAHGVDLNRNWPAAWRHNGRPWDGYYSGPRPLSEPEDRAMSAFILRVKPALTIWYHQPLDEVYGSDPHVAVLRRYARLSGLPYRRLQAPRGAATRWERVRFPHGAALRRRVPGRPVPQPRRSAPEREGRARPVRPVSSSDAGGGTAVPGRAGLDGAAGAGLAARARGRQAAAAALLPLRLVLDLNE